MTKIIESSFEADVETYDNNSMDIGFTSNLMIQSHFPHRQIDSHSYKKICGDVQFSVNTNAEFGLPFGPLARLLMIWITSEAVRRQSKEILIEKQISKFIDQLGLNRTGKDIQRVKSQFLSIANTSISIRYNKEKSNSSRQIFLNTFVFEKTDFLENKIHLAGQQNWVASVLLNDSFFNEIISRPIPLNLEVIAALKNSSLSLDIYSWLTAKMSNLNQKIFISWEALKPQFGSDYGDDRKGLHNFKQQFLAQLKKVSEVYPEARIELWDSNKGLILYPSPTSVPFHPVIFGTKKIDPLAIDRIESKESGSIDADPIVLLLMNRFNIEQKQAYKMIEDQGVEVVIDAIEAAEEWISQQKEKVRSVSAIVKKAVKEKWKSHASFKVEKKTIKTMDFSKKVLAHIEAIENGKFKDFLTIVRDRYKDNVFNDWFLELDLEKIENKSEILLSVDTKFKRDWIFANYSGKFTRIWEELLGTRVVLNIKARK